MIDTVKHQFGKWKVVKKEPGDFCPQLPWKATTGGVCSDHKTEVEAIEAAKDSHQRDIEQKQYQINQQKLRHDAEAKIILNEIIANKFRELYKEAFPFLNNSSRDWVAEFADILRGEPIPQWVLDEWTDLKQREGS